MNPERAVIQLTMTTSKINDFVPRNIVNQNKHKKVYDYHLLTNLGEKLKKKTLKKDGK